jgi:hypothetical protein
MPFDHYQRLGGVRSSDLIRLATSPLHYHRPPLRKGNAAMLRAIHASILEPDVYKSGFTAYDGVRRGKAYEEFAAYHAGKDVLTPAEVRYVAQTTEAVRAHRIAGPLLDIEGISEATTTYHHEGQLCQARLDRWIPFVPVIVDLKGYGTANPRRVSSMIARMGAHIQAAHYVMGAHYATGIPVDQIKYYVLAYETAAPYDVGVVELTHEGALGAGLRRWQELMDLLADLKERDDYPGCCPDLTEAVLPTWATAMEVSDSDDEVSDVW